MGGGDGWENRAWGKQRSKKLLISLAIRFILCSGCLCECGALYKDICVCARAREELQISLAHKKDFFSAAGMKITRTTCRIIY